MWAKKLDVLTFDFNLETLTYTESTKIFVNMKSSALLCVSEAINITDRIHKMSDIMIAPGKNYTDSLDRKNSFKNMVL